MASSTDPAPAAKLSGNPPVLADDQDKESPLSIEDTKDRVTDEAVQLTRLNEKEGQRVVQTPSQRRRALFHFLSLCGTIYVAGWNDGTLGPLLPRLQEVYNVSKI